MRKRIIKKKIRKIFIMFINIMMFIHKDVYKAAAAIEKY